MEQYYPGDVVIRTKYGTGMTGIIIKPHTLDKSYIVEVLTVPRGRGDRWTHVGEKIQWGTRFFKLLYSTINREPDWEV